MRKYIRLLAMMLIVIIGYSTFAYGSETIDLAKKGMISVNMRYQGQAVGGGSLTLYRVGDIVEADGNYSFQLASGYEGSRVSLSHPSSSETARALEKYISEQKITGEKKQIDKDGYIAYTNIKTGLYLIMQEEAASGYSKVSPFLISVPLSENGKYSYEVDATPKVDIKRETTPDIPKTPDKPREPKLPQTGQLNWPIPFLVIAGLLLFSIGWMMRVNKKE